MTRDTTPTDRRAYERPEIGDDWAQAWDDLVEDLDSASLYVDSTDNTSETDPIPGTTHFEDVDADSVNTDHVHTESRSVEAVAWQDDDGTVHVDGPDGEIATDTELPSALDTAYSEVDSIGVSTGNYLYSSDLYIPSGARIHFDDVLLQPDGCNGLRIGDGEALHENQYVTGKLDIDSNAGDTTATRGLYVYGAKLLRVEGHITIDSGFSDSAFHIDAGDEGTWWNSYHGIQTRGRVRVETTGEAPPNAHSIQSSLFMGQMDIIEGNGIEFTNCWFEAITDGDTIDLQNDTTHLSGRFEQVDIDINSGKNTIDVRHNTGVSVNWDMDQYPDNRVYGPDTNNRQQQVYSRGANSTHSYWIFNDDGIKNSEDAATIDARCVYSPSGDSNVYRAVAARSSGYYFSGQQEDGTVQSEIEVEGDFKNNVDGKGYVATTPDGTSQYRITVDNTGAIVTEEI